MGSEIEINDTLKISKERGFPKELDFDNCNSFLGKEFEFWNEGERLYHRPPTRVFLVEEIGGKWLYWGHALVISQTIEKEITKGRFKIIKIYNKEYQKQITIEESPESKSYFSN